MSQLMVANISKLSKIYKTDFVNPFTSLNNFNLKISKGESIGIIGKNGSGKSTLLKLLAGVIKPSSGKIELYGKVSSILDIGSGFHPDLSGKDNIKLAGNLNGMESTQVINTIPEIIEFSELGEFIDVPVKNYSNGMYLRLAFSVFMFLQPQILLLDEVFSVGDQSFQQKCYKKLLELKEEGVSLIIVSHNMHDITRICDRVVILEKGNIVLISDPHKAVDSYMYNNIESDFNQNTLYTSYENKVRHTFSTNDRNKNIHLLEAKLYPKDDKMMNVFFRDKSIVIELNFEQLIYGSNQFIITLTTSQNDIALTDSMILRQNYQEVNLKPGFYTQKIEIPANLLSKGIYFINLITAIDYQYNQKGKEYNRILSFEMRNPDWLNERPWLDNIRGNTQPELKWILEEN